MRFFTIIFFLLAAFSARAQTLGGKAAFSFLNLPASPLLTASGGVNVSYSNNDIGLASYNPSLLNEALHSQLGLTFNSFFAGVKAYQLAGAYQYQPLDATLGGSLFYIDYGNLPQTDNGGNVLGEFRPRDLVFQLSGSKQYLEKWSYGFTGKFIASNYGSYRSNAIAFDVGLHYHDTAHLFSAGLLAKNMGVQLTNYTDVKEELPFDLEIGITKRLEKAPFGFSLTAQQLHHFVLGVVDTTRINKPTFANKLFNHFVFSTHVYLGKTLEVTAGYNRLRRNELSVATAGNGVNGFSAGFKAAFKKLQFQYARAYYQRNGAYNQFGINVRLANLESIF